MRALGSAVVAFVLRYVLLEVRPVARDEAALGTAELSFETLRRGSPQAGGPVLLLLLLLGVCSRSFRCMSLKLKKTQQSQTLVIKTDRRQPLTAITTFPEAFLESWVAVLAICPRSGFLIPCMSLMWFLSITLVANVVLLSVQYLKRSASNTNDLTSIVAVHGTAGLTSRRTSSSSRHGWRGCVSSGRSWS